MTTKTRIIPMLSVLLLVLFQTGVFAKSGTVLAVLSFDNPAYRETLKGFTAASGLVVTEYVMASDEKELSAAVTKAKAYDAIFAIGSKAYAAAKKTTIPVVFSMVFVESSEGGAGVTLSLPGQIKADKIKEFLPKVKKVGIIYSEESTPAFNDFSTVAQAAGFTVTGKKVDGAEGFNAAFETISSASECFLMLPDTKLYSSQTIKSLFTASIEKKIPVIGLSSIYTKAGAFISLDCDYTDIGAQAGEIAADISGGKKGKVVYPRKVTISINSSIAKMMGVDGSSSKADQIF